MYSSAEWYAFIGIGPLSRRAYKKSRLRTPTHTAPAVTHSKNGVIAAGCPAVVDDGHGSFALEEFRRPLTGREEFAVS